MAREKVALVGWLCASSVASMACGGDTPSLLVEVSSDVAIPRDANALRVRIADGEATIETKRYDLGAAPRDRWPQTLPILRGAATPDVVAIEASAWRTSTLGEVEVARGRIEARFPGEGAVSLRLPLERTCREGACPADDRPSSDACVDPGAPHGGCSPLCSDAQCGGGECLVACDQPGSCAQMQLTCPPGRPCTIRCSGPLSCQGASITCPDGHPCTLECTGDVSCMGTRLACGGGACTARCLGTFATAEAACGSACRCDSTCGP